MAVLLTSAPLTNKTLEEIIYVEAETEFLLTYIHHPFVKYCRLLQSHGHVKALH